jgi:hypothetical protein
MIGVAALAVVCTGGLAIYATLQKTPPRTPRLAAATIPPQPPRREVPAQRRPDEIGRMLEKLAFEKPAATSPAAFEKPVARVEPAVEKPKEPVPPRMTAAAWRDLDEALARQIKRCWTYPKAKTIAPYAPKMKVVFARDGSLSGAPVLLNGSDDPAAKAIAASARAAMSKCKSLAVPQRFQAHYDEWKVRVIHFDVAT